MRVWDGAGTCGRCRRRHRATGRVRRRQCVHSSRTAWTRSAAPCTTASMPRKIPPAATRTPPSTNAPAPGGAARCVPMTLLCRWTRYGRSTRRTSSPLLAEPMCRRFRADTGREAPDLDRPVLPAAQDLTRTQSGTQARRRAALLRRYNALAAAITPFPPRRPPWRITLQSAPLDTDAININRPSSPRRRSPPPMRPPRYVRVPTATWTRVTRSTIWTSAAVFAACLSRPPAVSLPLLRLRLAPRRHHSLGGVPLSHGDRHPVRAPLHQT
jgi:hypothetical protein